MKQKKSLSFLYVISAIFIGTSFALWPLIDPNLSLHLLGGEYTYTNKLVPSFDFINTFNTFWHDYHWLAQLLFYKFYSIDGFYTLGILQVLLGVAFSLSLLFLIYTYRPKVGVTVKAISFLFIFYLIFQTASLKPQLISLSLITLTYALLLRKNKGTKTFLTTLLFSIICVNTHIYWIFIPFLWLILVCFKEKDLNTKKRAYLCLLVLIFSGLISPYGILHQGNTPNYLFLNYALVWEYLSMPENLKNHFFELQSVLKAKPSISLAFCLLIFLLGKKLNLHYIRKNPFILTLSLLGLLLALRSSKFLSILAILVTPIVIDYFASNRKIINKYQKIIISLFFVLAIIICSFSIYTLNNKNPIKYNELLPFKSCKKLANIDTKVRANIGHLRVLIQAKHGGWCKFITNKFSPNKDIRFTTDSRTEWVSPNRFSASSDLFNVKNNWEKTLKDWSPDYAIIGKKSSLNQFISRDYINWKIIQEDNNFVLYKNIKF